MSEQELRRAEALARVQDGELKLVEAAQGLGLGYRQTKRLWRRYRRDGPAGLVHGHAGRKSQRAKPDEFRERVVGLVRERYPGLGPTLAAEHLASEHGLRVDHETLRRWLLAAGLWRRSRKRAPHRRRRERQAHFGELLQLDGSPHAWLEERGPAACLMNLVDDATGRALCRFSGQETTWAAADVLEGWVRAYGIPQALYCDWKNVYQRAPTSRERIEGVEPETQFGRMCAKLGIKIIAASSPQAKGRVERHHGTHQDRLIKKLRLRGISDYEAANRYLDEEYLAEHNARFARLPAAAADFHLPLPRRLDLERVFCREQERVVGNDGVVRFENQLLQLQRKRNQGPGAGARVTGQQGRDGSLRVECEGRRVGYERIAAADGKERPPRRPAARRTAKPAADHRWRRYGKRVAER